MPSRKNPRTSRSAPSSRSPSARKGGAASRGSKSRSLSRKKGSPKTTRAKSGGASRPTNAGGRTVGYAVVGLGHIAQNAVLPAFENAKRDARLVALVTGDTEKAAKLGRKHKVPVFSYEQFDECLALPEVDAVYIALPNHLHREYTERAARAGVHVLCEKPMALTAADCEAMIRACEETDVRLMIAYRLHFERANLQAVDLVRKGKLGDPRYFSSTFSFQVQEDNIRVKRETGGGVLWDIGIYCLNAARMLFQSEPIEVFAQAVHGEDPRFAEVEQAVSATLRFPNDRLASFIVSFGAADSARYQVVGTEGDLTLESAYEYEGELSWTLRRKGREQKGKVGHRDQFGPELAYFSRCVLEGIQPEPDGREGLADVRVLEALYSSIESGKPVTLPPFEKAERPSGEQRIERPRAEKPELVAVEAPHQ